MSDIHDFNDLRIWQKEVDIPSSINSELCAEISSSILISSGISEMIFFLY